MTFLRLSSHLINISKISHISIKDSMYSINITSNNPIGFMIAGSGFLNCEDKLDIHKDKDPEDYKVVSKWIDNLDNLDNLDK